jgi:hypothetical protein
MALHLLGPGRVVLSSFEERDCLERGFGGRRSHSGYLR